MEIRGTITLTDGTTSEFSITEMDGYMQWGANTERLGRSVYIVSAITEKLYDDDLFNDAEWTEE